MRLRIEHFHHFESDPAVLHRLEVLERQLDRMEKIAMAISPQVQTVLDAIAINTSLVASVDAGFKLEATQITDLQTQIATLTATIASGGTLSADDITALGTAAQQLADTNAKLQADVPAATAAPASS